MIDARVLLGMPLNFRGLCQIFPPTVNDVLTKTGFPAYKTLLTISQEEIEDDFAQKNIEGPILTPLQFILESSKKSEEVKQVIEEAFEFFLHITVTLLPEENKILLVSAEELLDKVKTLEDLMKLPFLTEDNYLDFQNTVRQVCGEKPVDPPRTDEPEKLRRMRAKARYRDKIKAKQDAKNGLGLGTNLAAICCMGIGLNPLNIGEISYPCVGWLTSLYQGKEKYDIDIRSLQAGAKKKDVQPKYWISNLDDK